LEQALVIIDMQMLMQHRLDAGRYHVRSDAPAKIVAHLKSDFADIIDSDTIMAAS